MTHEERLKYEEVLELDLCRPAVESIDPNVGPNRFMDILSTAEDKIKEDIDNARTTIIIEYSIINDLRHTMAELIKMADDSRKDGNTDEAGKYEEACSQFYDGIGSCLENIDDKSHHLNVLESSLVFVRELRDYYKKNNPDYEE